MFKDRNEELRRLEEELLLEEELAQAEARWEQELEEADIYLDDPEDFGEETEETYYNYSNQYGAVRAYNSDVSDEDLEAYSQQVYEGDRNRGVRGLIILAAFLTSAIITVLLWCVLRFYGVLG